MTPRRMPQTMEEYLAAVHGLPFSKRQLFFQTLQLKVRSRLHKPIAWPDLILFVERDDLHVAWVCAIQP